MLPTEFIDEIRAQLGDALPAFLTALEQPPALALRINPLRGQPAVAAASPFAAEPVPWANHGFYLTENTRPGASLAHALGAFYLQEASAMVSASALDPRPGERILDLCAAPGGKTTQIAAAMAGEGLLVSNEPVPSRAKMLAENLERMGVVNAVAVCAWPDQLAARWPDAFDAVLTDAPCSGEGMFRREPASRDEWRPNSPAGCARRQADILDSAAKLVRPGGRLVYSTCTFNRAEDEFTIAAFLDRHPEFSPEDFSLPGLGASKDGMLRVWPHLVRGDGHFVARLRKSPDAPRQPVPRNKPVKTGRPSPKRAPQTISEETPEQLLARLEADVCRIPEVLRGGRLIRQADYVHLLPADTPDLDGIKTTKPGLCLMRVGRSHIQPMPALALAAQPACVSPLPNLACALRAAEVDELSARRLMDGDRAAAPDDLPKGWTLLTWNGLPVCFRKGNVIHP